MMRDHYETLGLDPDASEPEIKAAYRTLVRSLHPDVRSGGEGGATDRLLEVQRAYEVLSHPGRRASYDAGLPEGMESMLQEGGVADTLADVLTVVRREAVNGASRGAMAEPWERIEERPGSRTWGRGPTRSAQEAAAAPGPDLPTPTGDRTFLVAVGASLAVVAVAGAAALRAIVGAVGLIDLLSFLLMTLLAPMLALLGSWALSYADGRLEAALRRLARRLRAARERQGSVAAGPSSRGGGELLRLLVLLTAGGVYALVGAAPGAFVLALLSGVAFAHLHRLRLEPGPRRLLLACNLLVAFCALGLAGAAWHGSEMAAAGALLAGDDTATAALVRRMTGLVGILLVVVALYVAADVWHDLADRGARGVRADRARSGTAAGTGRRALDLAARPVAPVAGLLALVLEGLATVVRTCSMPGTLIRRAVGGGWL